MQVCEKDFVTPFQPVFAKHISVLVQSDNSNFHVRIFVWRQLAKPNADQMLEGVNRKYVAD